jgi:hypothetical protein
MTPKRVRRLSFAPELITIDAANAALRALATALHIEHFVTQPEARDDPPIRRTARVVLRRVDELRRALCAYRRAVDDALGPPPDFPF